MALTKCKECGHQIAKSAKACPSCGAKVKRTGCFTMGLAILFAFVIFSAVVGSCEQQQQQEAKAKQAAEQRAAEQLRKAEEKKRLEALSPEERAAEEKRLAEQAEQQRIKRERAAEEARLAKLRSQGLIWNYQRYTDDLTGKPAQSAWVKSVNEVDFGFPYNGPQRATLMLRKHPKYGNDAILKIERGQFVCGVDDCMISIRFDSGAVQRFGVAEAADHSTETLFLTNYSRFLQQLKKAKKVYVSAVVYQEGSPTFEFNAEGLDWK